MGGWGRREIEWCERGQPLNRDASARIVFSRAGWLAGTRVREVSLGDSVCVPYTLQNKSGYDEERCRARAADDDADDDVPCNILQRTLRYCMRSVADKRGG